MRVAAVLLVLVLAGCASPGAAPRDEGPAVATTTTTFPRAPAPSQPAPAACVDRWPCVPYDLVANGAPRFASALHLDLENVSRVTRSARGSGTTTRWGRTSRAARSSTTSRSGTTSRTGGT